MEEIFDNLLTKIFFSIMFIGILYLYRYAHLILYPQAKKQVLNLFNPFENISDSIHYFSRIVGISIVFSSINIQVSENLTLSIVNFAFWTIVNIIFYLLSLYILELIVLHAFQYQQEILKRKNISYAIVSAVIAICLSFLIKNTTQIADNSIPFMIIVTLYTIVIFGLFLKQYHLVSRFSFSKSIIGQDLGVVISHAGFCIAATIIVHYCFKFSSDNLENFITTSLTYFLLCGILLPFFYYFLQRVFLSKLHMAISIFDEKLGIQHNLGITECMLYLSSTLLTIIIVFNINFY